MLALLVVPISAITLLRVFFYGYTRRQFVSVMPLLFIQLNTTYVWIMIGNYYINPVSKFTFEELLNYSKVSLKYLEGFAYLIEPLNSLVYTWMFTDVLVETYRGSSKIILKVMRYLFVVLLGVVNISLYIS